MKPFVMTVSAIFQTVQRLFFPTYPNLRVIFSISKPIRYTTTSIILNYNPLEFIHAKDLYHLQAQYCVWGAQKQPSQWWLDLIESGESVCTALNRPLAVRVTGSHNSTNE
jgi:hypothetical protein